MDPDVAQLVREERLLEAAKTASDRGDHRLSSDLYERACDWCGAAKEALSCGDAARALELAAEGADTALAEAALALVPKEASESVAAQLVLRGHDRWAARVLEARGLAIEAARMWERAGEPLRAARLLEASDPAGAARVLEAGLRRDPSAWDVATALGALLTRFGKLSAAVRVLQRVSVEAPQRREALTHLVSAFEGLGLERAASEASLELEARGGPTASAWVAAPPELHPRIFGRYDLVREVASSPSARVLECIDVVRGERVAVKVFAAWDTQGTGRDALNRFEREVHVMRALDHPNIVSCRDYIPEGPAIVLAWMPGGTLERMLAMLGPLAPARAVEIADNVLLALGEAHRVGILHRDVKPGNVLFDDAGGARLSDFGVAHLGDVSTTATAGVFGTLAYMSPEQREGRPATVRSDVYAVGIMLLESITGERVAPGVSPRLRPSDAHRELGPTHDDAIARLTAIEPSMRPVDAFEARASITALSWPSTADTPALGPRGPRRRSAGPRAARLEVRADGSEVDTWTGRLVERLPATPTILLRARAFAAAEHDALQSVLRFDHDDGTLWLEHVADGPLRRALTSAERSCLTSALDALHAAGVPHGSVDAAHIVEHKTGVVLRFAPDVGPTATIDRDRIALGRL